MERTSFKPFLKFLADLYPFKRTEKPRIKWLIYFTFRVIDDEPLIMVKETLIPKKLNVGEEYQALDGLLFKGIVKFKDCYREVVPEKKLEFVTRVEKKARISKKNREIVRKRMKKAGWSAI